jgi:hypothetical protein
MLTGHAVSRGADRLADSGIDARVVLAKAEKAARLLPADASVALLMARLPRAHGDTTGPLARRESNGDTVWAIIRRGRVVTLMLRRSDQTRTPEDFRVDRVLRLKEG